MQYYVVGDIHGRHGIVRQIREYFERQLALYSDARIIFLGDYIDRGGYEKEVLAELCGLSRGYPGKCFFLLGNHDFMLLDLLFSLTNMSAGFDESSFKKAFAYWWMVGGYTTLCSFSGASVGGIPGIFDFLDNFQEMIPFYNCCVGKVKVIADLPGRPGTHFRLTHAGPQEKDMKLKDSKRRIWSRLQKAEDERPGKPWHVIEEEYLDRKRVPDETRTSGSRAGKSYNINVFGHTPASTDDIILQNDKYLRPVDVKIINDIRQVAVASLLSSEVQFFTADRGDELKYKGNFGQERFIIGHCVRNFIEYFSSSHHLLQYQKLLNPATLLDTTITLEDERIEEEKTAKIRTLIGRVIKANDSSVYFSGGRKNAALERLSANVDRMHPDVCLMNLCNIALVIRGSTGNMETRSGRALLDSLNLPDFRLISNVIRKTLKERGHRREPEGGALTYYDLMNYTGRHSCFYQSESAKTYIYGLAGAPSRSLLHSQELSSFWGHK